MSRKSWTEIKIIIHDAHKYNIYICTTIIYWVITDLVLQNHLRFILRCSDHFNGYNCIEHENELGTVLSVHMYKNEFRQFYMCIIITNYTWDSRINVHTAAIRLHARFVTSHGRSVSYILSHRHSARSSMFTYYIVYPGMPTSTLQK